MALILIIDDSYTARRTIGKTLKNEGYETMEAANGREGLEVAAANKPDCILLDLIMPEVDGFEVLRSLRALGSETPVIVLTADIQKIVREECLDLGATAFINKPPTRNELSNTIRKALDPRERVSNGLDS